MHDLGIFIDSDVSIHTHVSKTVAKCFAFLRRLRSIRRLVSHPVTLFLVTALTTRQLDYGVATLAGIPGHLMNRLQSVLNAAAHLVYKARKYDNVGSTAEVSQDTSVMLTSVFSGSIIDLVST